jgi:GntR family transcriptional regulator
MDKVEEMMITGDQVYSIDKSIPTPLYYQLLQIIKQQISSGDLKTGDTIPTEKELMELYHISRATVRQAVMQLVNEGYLRREKSKGTFVLPIPQKFRFMEGLHGFSADMRKRGIPYHNRVLEKAVIPANEKIAELLAIPVGEQVFFLKRLRYVADQPFLIDYHYIPYRLCEGIETRIEGDVSLYDTMEKDFNIQFHHGWREFEPIMPTSREDIELLGIYSTTSLLYVESLVYDSQGVPVDYFENKIHGKFVVDTVYTEKI